MSHVLTCRALMSVANGFAGSSGNRWAGGPLVPPNRELLPASESMVWLLAHGVMKPHLIWMGTAVRGACPLCSIQFILPEPALLSHHF